MLYTLRQAGICKRKIQFLFALGCLTTVSIFRGLSLSFPVYEVSDTIDIPKPERDRVLELINDDNLGRRSAEVQRKQNEITFARLNRLNMIQKYKQSALREGNGPLGVRRPKAYRRTIGPPERKYPRVIQFVHIHKSAGSLFCRMAFKNKVNANQKENCNIQSDQYCCGTQDTLEAQKRFATMTYWDLVATERDMYENMAPSHFDYVVCLRRAKDRYYSHWSHLRRLIPVGPGVQTGGFGDPSWIFGNNTIRKKAHHDRKVEEGEDPLGTFQEWLQGQPDNWNTRVICGPKCRPRPKLQITPALFNYTLHRVDLFAHFLFVEEIEASYNQMAKTYDWKNYTDVATSYILEKGSKRRWDKNGSEKNLAAESWDPIMSALDDALYEFAKRKFNNDTDHQWDPFSNQAELDRYFIDGPKLNCSNGCCGRCSPY